MRSFTFGRPAHSSYSKRVSHLAISLRPALSYRAQGTDVLLLGVGYRALRAAADRFASWSM